VNNTNLINNNQDSFYKDVSHADFLPALHVQQTPVISPATNVILCTDITQKPTNDTKSHINHYARIAFALKHLYMQPMQYAVVLHVLPSNNKQKTL
jgi:hypothetical protein